MHQVKVLLATAVVSLGMCASAHATTVLFHDGRVAQPYQWWANNSHVAPTPRVVVTVHERSCPGEDVLACSGIQRNPFTFDLYLPTRNGLAFFHELGHVQWAIYSRGIRHVFRTLIERSDEGYEEDFATGYSACALGIHWRTGMGMNTYSPTRTRHKLICRLIRYFGQV